MTDAEKDRWIKEDIPHRIRAAAALLDTTTEIANLLVEHNISRPKNQTLINSINDPSNSLTAQCCQNAIWEGRKIALRWLIELIGIKWENKGNGPTCVKPRDDDIRHDSLCSDLYMKTHHEDAHFLAEVWNSASKASAHGTTKELSVEIREAETVKALLAIIRHLNTTLYQPLGLDIVEISFREAGT